MALFSLADILTALFLLITVFDALMRRDARRSSRALTLTMIASVVLVLLDAGSGFTWPAAVPAAVLYIARVFSVIATKGILMFFYLYCYRYFRERTAVGRRFFFVPMILLALTMLAQAVTVFSDGYMTVSGGTVIVTGSMPGVTNLAMIVLSLYLPVLAVIRRKSVGTQAVYFTGVFSIVPIVLAFVGLHDYSTCFGAFVVFVTYVLLQNGIYNQREREQRILEESKAELESLNNQLEDNQAEMEAQIEEITALNTQLEDNQAEMEAQIEEITALNTQLEDNRAELQASSAEQEVQLRQISELNAGILQILKSMADMYYSMHLINLEDDTMVDFNAQNEVKRIADHPQGAAQMMADVIRATVTDEYLAATLASTDLTTLRARMKNKKLFSIEFVGRRLGWTKMSFIAVKADRDSLPIEVICVTRCIEAEKKKEEVLLRASNTDALTELSNRRAYEAALDAETVSSPDLVYVAMDVNRLKFVNDNLGHAAGDELLTGAADCMRKCFAPYGQIFRTGGDEFAAILHISPDALEKTAGAFAALVGTWSGSLVTELHIAMGCASAAQDSACQNLQQLAALADQRMYADKAEFYRQNGIDRRQAARLCR